MTHTSVPGGEDAEGVPGVSAAQQRARSLQSAFTSWRLGTDFRPKVQRWFLAYFRLEEATHAAGGVCFHSARLLEWQQQAGTQLDQLVATRGLVVPLGEVVEHFSGNGQTSSQ